MRLAFFASSFHPHIGGVEELVRQLSHEFDGRGYEVIVVTNQWPPDLPARETYEGIPVYRFPLRIDSGGWRPRLRYRLEHGRIERGVLDVLRRHRIELIHVQCVSTNGYYAQNAAAALGLPLVVTAQGERTMDADRVYERPGGLNDVLRNLLSSADWLTGCSRSVLDDLREYRGRDFSQPAEVIHNGVSLAEFDDPNVKPYEHTAPFVFALGRLVPQKGFDVLIRAFAGRTDRMGHDLIIAGVGPERTQLDALVAELGLERRVRLIGATDRRQTVALFKGCSMFVLPSRIEPLGIVNLEAMAARAPVLATRVGGVPEIVHDGITGILVPPDDVDRLAEALTHICADEALRRRLGTQGRAFAEGLAWPRIADQYEAVYRKCVSTQAAPHSARALNAR